MDKEVLKEKLILVLIFASLFFLMVIMALFAPYKEVCTCKQNKCIVKSYYLQNYYDINYFDRAYYGSVSSHHRHKGGSSYDLMMGRNHIFKSSYLSYSGAQKDLSKIQTRNDFEIVKINWYQNFIKSLIGWMYLTIEQ